MKPGLNRQYGFTYLALLFVVAIFGVTSAVVGMSWSISQKRDKEMELLFRGEQIRRAISSYYERTPGSIKRYPATLEELLNDKRHLATLRHLRRVYTDPMTETAEWGLVRAPDGGVMGVFSTSQEVTLKRIGPDGGTSQPSSPIRYSDWKFVYEPPGRQQ